MLNQLPIPIDKEYQQLLWARRPKLARYLQENLLMTADAIDVTDQRVRIRWRQFGPGARLATDMREEMDRQVDTSDLTVVLPHPDRYPLLPKYRLALPMDLVKNMTVYGTKAFFEGTPDRGKLLKGKITKVWGYQIWIIRPKWKEAKPYEMDELIANCELAVEIGDQPGYDIL